jgi:ribosomal protein S18 acetylase RimI-like enzyme
MHANLEIRAKVAADNQAIYELFRRPGFRYRGTIQLDQAPDQNAAPPPIELVATCGNRFLGYAGLFRQPTPLRGTASIHMGILDECRARGLADALLRDLMATSPDSDRAFRGLELTVYATDEGKLQPPAALGFLN